MVQTILSLAKTSRPTLALVAARQRLFRELDDNIAEAPSLWIAGPPGSGKTTLIASYLEARGRPTLWYQLDAADGDIATFLYYLRQTALKHSPDAITVIPQLSAGDEGDWTACARRILRAVFARFERGLAVVFDNQEEVPQHSVLHAILAVAVDEAPPGRSIFVLSRNAAPPPFARAQMNRKLRAFPSESLRLTPAECQAVAALRKAELEEPALNQIQSLCAGWVAGAILLMEHARNSAIDAPSAGVETMLYDYVAHEVFQRFDEHVQRLLLEICWVRRLSLALAEGITGDSRIRQTLVSLALNNYFVTERDDNGQREFILHPLLRDFLQAKAQAELDRRKVADQQLRCAALLIEFDNVEEAVDLLVSNLAWDDLESVILSHAPLLVAQARRELLRAWIEELPLERVAASAWLTYWHGMSHLGRAQRASRRSLERALHLFAGEHDAQGVAHAACGLIELVLEEMDDLSVLDVAIGQLRQSIEALPAILDEGDGDRKLVLFVVASALRHPAGLDPTHWLPRADGAARRAGNTAGNGGLPALVALADLLLGGRMHTDSELAELLRGTSQGSGSWLRARLVIHLYALLRGEPAAALDSWRETLREIPDGAPARGVRLARIGLVAAGLLANRPAEIANEVMQVRAQLDADDKLSGCLGHYVVSWAALCEDDLITAFRHQQHALTCAVELGMPFLEVLCRTALAQLLFQCRDPRAGSSQLRRVHTIARDIRNPLLEHLTLLVYGEVAIHENRPQSGINALRYAFGLGRQHGYLNLPWWHPRRLADLCVLALEHDVEVDFVRHLIRRHALHPRRPPVHLEHWPWRLTVRSFPALAVQADGVDVTANLGQGRPAQLFKLIVGGDTQGLRAEAAAEFMWPHVDAEYAIKSLTINLHRLRRLLEIDDLVLLRDGRLSLNSELVWLDTRALDQLYTQIVTARAALPLASERGLPRSLDERLLALYRGPWLGDEDAGGLAGMRARWRAQFLEAIAVMVAAHGRGDARRARALIEHALLSEPLAESLYALLLRLALDEQDWALAVAIYERCHQALANAGLTPSTALEALHATAQARGTA